MNEEEREAFRELLLTLGFLALLVAVSINTITNFPLNWWDWMWFAILFYGGSFFIFGFNKIKRGNTTIILTILVLSLGSLIALAGQFRDAILNS